MTRQEMQNTFAFIIEQQAKFEDNFTRAESRYGEVDKRFLRAEKRLDRLEKLAERLTRAADERMKRLEARTVVLCRIYDRSGSLPEIRARSPASLQR